MIQLAWEPDTVFRFHAGSIWRRGMAFELLKRMDEPDRDTKNAVFRFEWSALPDPAAMAVLLA